jgi:beta-galactosidase beta subunit
MRRPVTDRKNIKTHNGTDDKYDMHIGYFDVELESTSQVWRLGQKDESASQTKVNNSSLDFFSPTENHDRRRHLHPGMLASGFRNEPFRGV